ncbi:MAG: hypothetical protein HY752_02920 [Nitrospirae bacterium]|nr:hypothetical protein [Nitrospirota bacterium]
MRINQKSGVRSQKLRRWGDEKVSASQLLKFSTSYHKDLLLVTCHWGLPC